MQTIEKTHAAPPPGSDPLEYVMSDGSVDRVGDVIEPKGWQLDSFRKHPIAFFNHNKDFPIGSWKDVRVEGGELKGKLFLPPPESERQRELQSFVKAGVLRAVSVGFVPLEAEPLKESKMGGRRFTKQALLECSLVGIPANANALQIAKSLGVSDEIRDLVFNNGKLQAASGIERSAISNPPRKQRDLQSVSLKAMPKMAKKSLAEQVAALENARAAKAARMEEIQQKCGDEDRTKDDAEREEFNGLDIEIENIDKELQDLRKLERAMVTTAKAVVGHNSHAASESREPARQHVTHMQRQLPPGIAFARFTRCVVASGGIPISALGIAERQYPDMDDLHLILRAAVAAGNTHADTFAGNLIQYQVMASEFIEYLRPQTVIGRIPGLRRVPFNVRIPRQTAGASAYWVGEGQPKPVTSMAFDTVLLRWTKLANIAVLTDEVVRFANPAIDTLVRDDLAAAIIQQEDTDFLDPTNSGTTDVKPASVTNGVSATASTGATSDDARVDAVTVINKFVTNNIPTAGLVWVMNETTATVLSQMQNALGQPIFSNLNGAGGSYMGYPVVTSQVMAAAGSPLTSNIVLMRPQDIFLADDGQVQVDASREASLQMLDNPTNASTSGSPSAPTATTMVSMFQVNSVAVRAEVYINWVKARSTAVQYISGAAYAL